MPGRSTCSPWGGWGESRCRCDAGRGRAGAAHVTTWGPYGGRDGGRRPRAVRGPPTLRPSGQPGSGSAIGLTGVRAPCRGGGRSSESPVYFALYRSGRHRPPIRDAVHDQRGTGGGAGADCAVARAATGGAASRRLRGLTAGPGGGYGRQYRGAGDPRVPPAVAGTFHVHQHLFSVQRPVAAAARPRRRRGAGGVVMAAPAGRALMAVASQRSDHPREQSSAPSLPAGGAVDGRRMGVML